MANDINIVVAAQVQGAIGPLQQVQQQIGRVNNSVNGASAALRRHSREYSRASVSTNKFAKGALQQLGFQLGDYAVQVANGTSKMQAFGQQGSQLLGIFGPVGALLGAGVAIFSAFSIAASKAGGATFDFNAMLKDMQPALDVVRPLLDRVGSGFRFLKSVAIGAINGIINGIQYFLVTVGAIPDAIRAFIRKAELRLMAFASNVQAVMYDARASVQEFLDLITPGGPRAGFMTDDNGVISGTAVENFREAAANMRDLADELSSRADKSAGAFGALRDAINGVTAIDIRDYFTKAAEAIGGEGGNGGNSLVAALTDAQQKVQDLYNTIQQDLEQGFMSIVDGTKTVKDAFKSMAKSVISELYRVLVVQRLVGSFDLKTKTGSGIVGFLGRMLSFSGGGYTGAGSRSGGVDGRGGFPAILHPNETVIDHSRGQNMGGVVIHQTINVSTGVQQTVRAEIKQLMPQIAESAKSAVVDAKRRGGSYGRAFA